MTQWTPAQQSAIHADNRDILVSAAAGSGKTSVLIERIMEKLRQGMSIERMLIITFTRAASAEMRERLEKAIAKEAGHSAHLRQQYALLSNADISTLHTYCSKIIKRHFQAAGVDPMSRVDDTGQAARLLDEAVDSTITELYESPGADGQALIDHYPDKDIEAMLRRLYTFLLSQDDPWTWLHAQQELPTADTLHDHIWYQVTLHEARQLLSGAQQLIAECVDIAQSPGGPARYLNNATLDGEMADILAEALDGTGRLPEGVDPVFSDLSRAKAAEDEQPELVAAFKARRDSVKKMLLEVCAMLPASREQCQLWIDQMAFTLPPLRALCKTVEQLHQAYTHLKRRRTLWDFNDLEHLALQALKNPLAARDVAESLDAVFVDEYQDISRIQEAIILRIREQADLFMVGDVKQSIYRFRLADPGLFLYKYEQFEKDRHAPRRLIVLSQNFRSRTNILRAVNRVFEGTMRRDVTEIDYDEDAALRREPDTVNDPPVELTILTGAPEEERPAIDAQEDTGDADEPEVGGSLIWEARWIAERIQQLVGTMIQDKNGPRKASYRDMVILMRSVSGRAETVANILKDAGIPVFSDASAQYFDLREVDDVLNILKILDNPLQDEALMAALCTPCFGFTYEDLGWIRAASPGRDVPFYVAFDNLIATDERIAAAAKKLQDWRFRAQHMSVEAFLRYLLRVSGLYARAGALPGGELRRANLRLLCERAMNLGADISLSKFLARVSDARKRDDSSSASGLGENEDVVRIMTIHKSKGLEFPIVFLPGLSRAFRMASQGDTLLCDPDLGLSLRLRDQKLRLTHHTFSGRALMYKANRAIRSEEARLLYVAMTRARERLIMMAVPRSLPAAEKQWSLPQGDYAAGSAGSMMDWVGNALWPALSQHRDMLWTAPDQSVWDIRWRSTDSLLKPQPQTSAKRVPWPDPPTTPSPFVPLPRYRVALQKISVTALLESARAGDIEEETPEIKRRLRQLEKPPMALPVLGQKKRLTGAERGIAAHKALSGLALDTLRGLTGAKLVDVISQGLDALAQKDILTPEERAAADARAIARFFESDLGLRLLAAPRVEREWSFTLKTEGNLLLQGVIDCCFEENGQWVLADYKTDPDDRDGIMAKYRDQMRWYMRAMREITGQPVKDAYLYSLSRHVAWRVEEERAISLEEYKREGRDEP